MDLKLSLHFSFFNGAFFLRGVLFVKYHPLYITYIFLYRFLENSINFKLIVS